MLTSCSELNLIYDLRQIDKEKLKNVTTPITREEARRLQVLRETGLLDSDNHDPQYDRFTALAKRIFNAPISIMNLIDVDRAYIKSITISFSAEDPRNNSVCAHLIGDATKDIMIVPNLLEDVRFKDLPITVNLGLRFYAGAALIVGGQKIGTLCIFTFEPDYNFDMSKRMNLLDLASTLSYIIDQRRNALMIRNNVLTNMTHNLRTPLSSLGMQLPLLEKEILAKNDVTSTLQDINQSYRRLHRTIEANVILSRLCDVVEAGRMVKEVFELNDFMLALKKMILDVRDEAKVLLNIDPIYETFSGFMYSTYPKVLELIVTSSISQFIVQTDKMNVDMTFQSEKEEIEIMGIINEENPGREGYVVISIEFNENKEFCTITQETNALECESILKLIGGLHKWSSEASKKVLKILMPCVQETQIGFKGRTANKGLDEKTTSNAAAATVTAATVTAATVTTASAASILSSSENTKSASSIVSDNGKGRRLKALIVEDSIPLLKTLGRWLKSADCDVTTAENGKLGLMQLTGGVDFDIVITDMLMPVMNGIEMMQGYKAWKDKQNFSIDSCMPLIVGTSATPPTTEAEILKECGMHLFFPKPINWAKMSKVLQLLREREKATAIDISTILLACKEHVFTQSFSMNF